MKKIKVLLILVMAFILVGCQSEDTKEKNKSKTSTNDTAQIAAVLENVPETYQKESGNVIFNAEVNLNGYDKEKGLVIATANLQKVNKEEAFNLLWGDEEYEDWGYESENEYGESVYVENGMDTDYMISYGSGPKSSQVYYSQNVSYIIGAFRLEKGYEDYNADKYSLTEQLEFMTREDAFLQLDNSLKQIGFEFEKEYKGYALDAKTMESEEQHMDMDGNNAVEEYKDSWTKEDDCYYFSVWQTYKEMPVLSLYGGAFSEYGNDSYAPVQAIISKDGIFSLNVDTIFQFSSDKVVTELADFEVAVEKVSNKYNQILGEGSYEISKIELVYIIDITEGKGTYELKPAWVFQGTQEDGSGIQTIIDAQTGNEVLL